MSWQQFVDDNPELARVGLKRLSTGVAYLATVRPDGGPRVHPVTPIIGEGWLFLFMEPTSPKGHDLRRDGRYALHCAVEDSGGGQGEFLVTGRANLVEDTAVRAVAVAASAYSPKDRYILFELSVQTALSLVYGEDNQIIRQRWTQ